jgi:hypothetical protein
MYIVELGNVEVMVDLLRKGHAGDGVEPSFDMTAGQDWEGNEIYLTEHDRQTVAQMVCELYPDEVYL